MSNKFKAPKTKGYRVTRAVATRGHSDFILENTNTGRQTQVPQTSFHRYVNDYKWNLADIEKWRKDVAPNLVQM